MLTNKQKSYLRGLANSMNSLTQIGKDGVTRNLTNNLKDGLEAHELIKINILKSCESDVREVALDIVGATKSELVQIIGRTIILYKQSKDKMIELPK